MMTGNISENQNITGSITKNQNLTGSLTENQSLAGTISESQSLTGSITNNQNLKGNITKSQSLTGKITNNQELTGNLAGSVSASRTSYKDNLEYGVNNVQDALDKVFDTMETFDDVVQDSDYVHTDNNFTDEDKDKLDSIGEIDNLDTENTDNLVNAINEIYNILYNSTGIKELVNADINVMAIEQGIYILSGRGTKLRRGGTTLVTNPVINNITKSILFLTRYATGLEEGILIQPSASRLMSVWTFSSTTSRRKDFLNLLTTNNVTAFTPTSYYNPVHKGYVDFGTDLGNIDLSEYNEDVFQFMDTLTNDGKYRFTDSGDGFTWCVEVYTAGDYTLGQTYWNTEEGYLQQYHRNGYYDENEDIYSWYDWTSFLNYETANSLFKRKGEADYTSTSVPDLRTWLDEMGSFGTREYEVIQTSNSHKFMVNIRYSNYKVGTTWNYVRYQEYYDIEEPNKIYRRSGKQTSNTASSPVNWGDWYVFEGTPE